MKRYNLIQPQRTAQSEAYVTVIKIFYKIMFAALQLEFNKITPWFVIFLLFNMVVVPVLKFM